MSKLVAAAIRMARATVYLLYSIEVGAVLMIAPWTRLWEAGRPLWHGLGVEWLLDATLVRGLVTGVGCALILDALIEALVLTREGRAP